MCNGIGRGAGGKPMNVDLDPIETLARACVRSDRAESIQVGA